MHLFLPQDTWYIVLDYNFKTRLCMDTNIYHDLAQNDIHPNRG